MKIAISILKYFSNGGLQCDFMQIAKEAVRRGHSVTVYTTTWNGERPDWLNIKILNPFAFTNHGKSVLFHRALHQTLKKDPCNVLLGMFRGQGLDFYFSGDHCFALNQQKKHSALFCKLSPRIRTFMELERAIFAPESKTKILHLVEQQKKEFTEFYHTPEDRQYIVPPGMNPDYKAPENASEHRAAFREKLGISDDRLILLCVGANLKLKGADRVIQAVNVLPKQLREKITLLLVGNKTRELESLAQGVQADIRFEGTRDHIIDYYLASDLMVHPARSESVGNVLIEALSCGLPVICTGLCGFSTYVQEAGAGHVLYGDFHQGELNVAIESLLQDRDHLKYLSREALEYTQHTDFTGRASFIVDLLEEYHGTR